jgi:hypothetical protein
MTDTGLPPIGGNSPYPPGFWEEIAQRAVNSPGLWVWGADDISTGVTSYLRRGRNVAFRREDGTFRFASRGEHYPDSDWRERKGTRRGTLYVSFIPNGWTQEDVEKAQAEAAKASAQEEEAEW